MNSQPLKEALPKYQCSSGRLRCKAEWGGSDPSICSDGETVPDSYETIYTMGRLKKLQKLVHIRNGHQSDGDKDTCTTKKHDCLTEGVTHHRTVITCSSLSRRTEKSSSKASAAPQLQQNTRITHEDPTEGGFLSPKMQHHRCKAFECPHTYHQAPHELSTHNGNTSSQEWNSEWDHFESLIQELERKQSDLPHRPPALTKTNCKICNKIFLQKIDWL